MIVVTLHIFLSVYFQPELSVQFLILSIFSVISKKVDLFHNFQRKFRTCI